MTYFRHLEYKIRTRIAEDRPLIQVVVGPRQVGKTTAIQQAMASRGLYETADSPTPLKAEDIQQWWELAEQRPEPLLAIDEVQKISGWSEIIKKLWDKKNTSKPMKLILSGSAALSIEKNLKETLVGRYELIRAEHWNFREAKEVFGMDLQKYVEFGCYPGSMTFLNDVTRWGAYVRDSIIEPVIGRDILQLHPIHQPALLRQLFGVAASLPGQIVSLNKLQGQLQDRGAIATLQHYLELLSQGFLVSGVQKFTSAPIRSKRSAPKLIVHDNGLMRALERPIHTRLNADQFGHYFENAIGARLIEAGWETYYWNERTLEVDFIAIGPNGQKLAIEVKSSSTSEKNLHGLREFCKRHRDFEPCLISFVDQKIEGIRNWPAEEVLSLSIDRS